MDRNTLKAELGFDPNDDPTDTEILGELLGRLQYEVQLDLSRGARGHYDYDRECVLVDSLDGEDFVTVRNEVASCLRNWNVVSPSVRLVLPSHHDGSHESKLMEAAKVECKAVAEKEDLEARTSMWRREVRELEARKDELKESVYESRMADLMAKKP